MESIAVLILAAGLGKRMGTKQPKVLAPLYGGNLIQRVVSNASELSPERLVVITGHGREHVEESVQKGAEYFGYDFSKISFAFQEEQLGTGHAVRSALDNLKGFTGTVLILCGDVPLIRAESLNRFVHKHHEASATLSLISVQLESPGSYGRIVRDKETGSVQAIVEAKDCSEDQLLIREINSGIYAVDSAFLSPAVEGLSNDNAQGEYYLTDIIGKAVEEGQAVSGFTVESPEEIRGVNTRAELQFAEEAIRRRYILELVNSGVSIADTKSLWIDPDAKIEPGAYLGPNVSILGDTKIETGSIIEGTAWIKNAKIGKESVIKLGCRIEDSEIGDSCAVGPFAHIRPGTKLSEEVKIGNFVETKKASLAKGAKASHLTYLGDCTVGEAANIGAGTITCNYDGYKKSLTEIGEGAFIGSNSSLVAPVKIARNAVVGAGSTITRSVEEGFLALTRAEQRNVPGWHDKQRKKMQKS